MPTHYVPLEPSNIQPAWCDRCNSTCAATFDVVTVSDEGVSTMGHGWHCPVCDPDE